MPYKDPVRRAEYRRQWERANYAKNGDRIRAYKCKWRAANRHKQYEYDRKCKLMRHFGLTVEQYEKMDRDQGGVCKICRHTNPDGTKLAVDHDHVTGAVRGLLCINCNKGLGHFKDDAGLLQEAARYLKEGITPHART